MKECDCEFESDGGKCIHCGKTVTETLVESLGRTRDHGYECDKSIKCKKCGHLFKPFYFGDKVYHRNVGQECPECDEVNGFRPSDVQGNPDEFIKGE